ncbi:HD domain-containing protein [Gudongella sp. DL1XJH-153]|uniref:HD domain-containing protein n=1 Tax=Gudongella sp. DL1XJH-153 TaxID=3409804 RepID=UPI003BB4D45B
MIRIKKAIRFAVKAHGDQMRKGTDFPYIEHPLHVGILLSKAGMGDEVVIAGILHDTLEDTDTTEDELRSEFGEEILKLIKLESEPDRTLPWNQRKNHTVEHLRNASRDVKMIALCDKLSNIMDIEADLVAYGDALWERFNAGYEEQKWYYISLVDALSDLGDMELYQEFNDKVSSVFE